MQRWLTLFNELKPRAQLLLLGGACVLVIYLFYLLVWQPVSNAKDRVILSNRVAIEDLQDIRALAAEYRQLERSGGQRVSGQNLSQIVDSSAARYQLSMSRFQPSSSGDVQIRFDNVSFNAIIAWLYDLESNNAVGVKDLSINPGNASGLVNVSVRLYLNG